MLFVVFYVHHYVFLTVSVLYFSFILSLSTNCIWTFQPIILLPIPDVLCERFQTLFVTSIQIMYVNPPILFAEMTSSTNSPPKCS